MSGPAQTGLGEGGTPARGASGEAVEEGIGQASDLPLDAHLHTDRSADSVVPIEVYAADALARGIREIAITDHVDFSAELPNFGVDVAERERLVRATAERWAARGVTIRFGVEISYEARHEEAIRDHLRRVDYDYAIGSCHIGPWSPYHASRVAAWVPGRPLADAVGPYFEEVIGAARSGLFDTIGHLDFVKRYLHPHVAPAELAAAPELYEPVLRALIETGTALEVNTSGLRQAPRETYPSPAIVARYRELGGRRVVAGSDAHLPESFAWGLEEGYRSIGAAGFEELAFRRGEAGRVAIPLPDRFRADA